MTLQQAAEQLGVHYMTAYRYVKLGLLYAEKQRGSWMITAEDLAAFRGAGGAAGSDDRVTGTFEDALVAGDEAMAWRIVEAELANAESPVDVHLEHLSPALVSIGQRWASGDLSIASEHRASAVANRIIARLGARLSMPGRRRGTVIVGAAPGDVHSIPSAMFADLLRSFGVQAIDLGGSPDINSFLEAIVRHPHGVVAISATGPGHEDAVISTITALRAVTPDLPVGVGGGAITSSAHANALGADLWHHDPRSAARLIADAAAARTSEIQTTG